VCGDDSWRFPESLGRFVSPAKKFGVDHQVLQENWWFLETAA